MIIDDYVYWDLIAEEAYKPCNNILLNGTYDSFIKELTDKTIYMFGCNAACKVFVETNPELRIKGILDNSSAKQGTKFAGKDVMDPNSEVQRFDSQNYVVLIAMRQNADKIADQLLELGFENFFSLGVLASGVEPYSSFIQDLDKADKLPLEDIIMMESTNDFDGNAGALYEYLKRKNSKHKFVWIIKNENNASLKMDDEDIVICPSKDVESLKLYIKYRSLAKWQIWDNHPIRKVREDQINVYLQHFGMGYKQIAKIFNSPKYVDFALNTNENVYEYEKTALLYDENTKMIFGELPRNDVLFSNQWNELNKLTDKHYDKVIIWAPTLRDSAMFNRVDSDIEYPFGISLIYTLDDMHRVNDCLSKLNVLLIIKIHPRQRRNYSHASFSNIMYIDGDSIKKVHSYKLLTQMDAMITDYSSMVFDYMLLDRPIAWVLEDMEHYKIPFLMKNPLDFMPGHHIYIIDQLIEFIKNVHDEQDIYKQARNTLSNEYNAKPLGKGCENIVNILGL